MSEPSNAELAADIRMIVGLIRMAQIRDAIPEVLDNLLLAAQRLEARGEVTEATIQKAAIGVAISEGCGLTIKDERTLCCDPRAEDCGQPQENCDCLRIARAALQAALSGKEGGHV